MLLEVDLERRLGGARELAVELAPFGSGVSAQIAARLAPSRNKAPRRTAVLLGIGGASLVVLGAAAFERFPARCGR